MNLFQGMKRLYLVLAVPGLGLIAWYSYEGAKLTCASKQGSRFYELVVNATERRSGHADEVRRTIGNLLPDVSIEYKALRLIERQVLPESEVRALQQQVEQENLCSDFYVDFALGTVLLAGFYTAVFWGLFVVLRIAAWVVRGFSSSGPP